MAVHKIFGLLLGGFAITVIWAYIFYPGTEMLRLTECFESQCSDISIRHNGTYWMTYSTQNDCYSSRGNYKIDAGKIHLYEHPNLDAENQNEAMIELMKEECVSVSAEDFRLWSECFDLTNK